MSDRGVALLEVMAALAILVTAGLALVELTAASVRAVHDAQVREQELAEQERLLAAYTLLTRADLDQRLGRREVGDYLITVQRPEAELYRIGIGRTSARSEGLVTVVHRARGNRVR